MSAPFCWVGTFSIKPGKREAARKQIAEIIELAEANEPRLIAFNFYIDEESGTASCVHVHPDAASMTYHMEVMADHFATVGEWMDKQLASEAYGTPPEGFVEGELEWGVDAAALRVLPEHLGGFIRTTAE